MQVFLSTRFVHPQSCFKKDRTTLSPLISKAEGGNYQIHTFEKIKVLLFLLINNMTFLYCYTLEN